MKHFRDIYLIGISFVAGVLFVIQCGGAARSVAAAVAAALDVTFTNTDTSLEATDVQNALSELDARFPVVFDADNNAIGVLMSARSDDGEWEIWSVDHQAFLYLNPSDGGMVYNAGEDVYYETSDCTGDPFILMISDLGSTNSRFDVVRIGDVYYVPANRGRYLTGTPPAEILSKKDNEGICSTEIGSDFYFLKTTAIEEGSTPTTFIEARELSDPSYTGPLSFGRDI